MAYHKTISLSGNTGKGLEVLRNFFVYQGFQLTELTATGFKAKNPVSSFVQFMAVQHNPVGAISTVEVEVAGGTLTIDAGMGSLNGILIFFAVIAIAVSVAILCDPRHRRLENFAPEWFIGGFIIVVGGALHRTYHKAITRRLEATLANAAMIAEFRG